MRPLEYLGLFFIALAIVDATAALIAWRKDHAKR